MARIVQLGALVTRCKQRCDRENDGQIGDANNEWKSLVSELYGELHSCLVEKGARYFETEATITANGAASYALPADHLTTIGIDYVSNASTDQRVPLDEIMVQERSFMLGVTGIAYAYALEGANVVLYPRPLSGTYKHLYVPQPTDLSAAADVTNVDLVNVHGEKFVIWGVASIALHKGEANQVRAVGERDKAFEALEYWATLRSINNPRRRVGMGDDYDPRALDAGDWRYR